MELMRQDCKIDHNTTARNKRESKKLQASDKSYIEVIIHFDVGHTLSALSFGAKRW